MTTYQGVAVATQAIGYAMSAAARAVVPDAQLTLEPPEQRSGAERDAPRVNLYLVQVVVDPTFRHADLPTRTTDGTLLASPQVALDLRYLVSYFGLAPRPQLMLGAVEVALHERPYLDATLIRNAVTGHPSLEGSGLDQQLPPVRVVPRPLPLEDLLSFWSGFFQSPYTLSTMYEASTILLDSPLQPAEPPPVQNVGVGAAPHRPAGGGQAAAPPASRPPSPAPAASSPSPAPTPPPRRPGRRPRSGGPRR